MSIKGGWCNLQKPGYQTLWLALFNPFPGLGYLLHGKPLWPPQDAATGFSCCQSCLGAFRDYFPFKLGQ